MSEGIEPRERQHESPRGAHDFRAEVEAVVEERVEPLEQRFEQLSVSYSRSSPFPDRDELDHLRAHHPAIYNEMVESYSQERQLRHRVVRERTQTALILARRGQALGFLVTLIFAVCCGIAVVKGNVVGVAGVLVALVPIIAILVLGREPREPGEE
jgi:hypothetical protein